jgi:hypothetical protein
MRFAGLLLATSLIVPARAFAQQEHNMSAMVPKWSLNFDGEAYLLGNLQERKFTDFHELEGLNWFMAEATRGGLGGGSLMVHSMLSFEPFTVHKLGYAEVFQTGETYQQQALVDYQHPHDLFMGLGAMYQWPAMGATQYSFAASLVGEPALGPEVFMHRPSAEANPIAPLSHHHLDSTHITHGVLTAGVSHANFEIEASAFHGREPDEDRLNLELGPIDSYSGRVSWRWGGWKMQVSAGHLKFPDPTEFTDENRFTASAAYTGELLRHKFDGLLAVGVDHETQLNVTSPAWLAEGAWHIRSGQLLYGRVELVDQDILTLGGYDPPGFQHPHVLSQVGAFTLGYERTVKQLSFGRFGLGGDATVYYTPPNLMEGYGHPFSAHIYLRYHFN